MAVRISVAQTLGGEMENSDSNYYFSYNHSQSWEDNIRRCRSRSKRRFNNHVYNRTDVMLSNSSCASRRVERVRKAAITRGLTYFLADKIGNDSRSGKWNNKRIPLHQSVEGQTADIVCVNKITVIAATMMGVNCGSYFTSKTVLKINDPCGTQIRYPRGDLGAAITGHTLDTAYRGRGVKTMFSVCKGSEEFGLEQAAWEAHFNMNCTGSDIKFIIGDDCVQTTSSTVDSVICSVNNTITFKSNASSNQQQSRGKCDEFTIAAMRQFGTHVRTFCTDDHSSREERVEELQNFEQKSDNDKMVIALRPTTNTHIQVHDRSINCSAVTLDKMWSGIANVGAQLLNDSGTIAQTCLAATNAKMMASRISHSLISEQMNSFVDLICNKYNVEKMSQKDQQEFCERRIIRPAIEKMILSREDYARSGSFTAWSPFTSVGLREHPYVLLSRKFLHETVDLYIRSKPRFPDLIKTVGQWRSCKPVRSGKSRKKEKYLNNRLAGVPARGLSIAGRYEHGPVAFRRYFKGRLLNRDEL